MLPFTSWLLLLAVIILPLSIVLRFYFKQARNYKNGNKNERAE
ncbi:MAG: hypothetical protein ACFCU6_00435 [Balneolaceae bacterium]